MKELVEYILKNLVDNPDDIEVTVVDGGENEPVLINVKLNDEDKGLVIGKEGRNINAIRTILSIKAKNKVILKVE